jgi:hypothetical protein
VAEHLSHQFVGARVGIQDDLGRKVPNLMRRELHAQVLADRLLDPVRHRVLFGRVAYFGVEPFLAGDTFAAEMSSTVTSIVDDIVATPAPLTPINGD